jgi:hypothetical protein
MILWHRSRALLRRGHVAANERTLRRAKEG